MSQVVKKGDGVEGMPRVTEVVWRVGPCSDEPYQIKIVKRNPKSIDILHVERLIKDNSIYRWEVWRQYPEKDPYLRTHHFKSKREAWEWILRGKKSEIQNEKIRVMHMEAAYDKMVKAMEEDPEVY